MLKRDEAMHRPDGNHDGSGAAKRPSPRWDGRFSITVTLVTAIGLLTPISARKCSA